MMGMRKVLAVCSMLLTSLLPVTAAHATATEGFDYQVLSPEMGTDSGKKIEVAEFFWYRCPHCYHLEPGLNTWLKTLPKDVAIRRIPAVLNDSWAQLAKAYYAMEALGVADKYHDALFKAIHEDGLDVTKDAILFDWAAKVGMDRKAFIAAYQSFGVQSKVMRANQLTRDSKITGVPSFVVDGTYVTSESMTGTEEGLFKTLDDLIVKVRKERQHHTK
ncbi:MAG: thiol:disulfide interchange protein DsbA/DsbL [Sulfuriferula sp.]|nr:thiol:disulfide interchange protein DsbA/DsbL [Sulfuriferula sp.]